MHLMLNFYIHVHLLLIDAKPWVVVNDKAYRKLHHNHNDINRKNVRVIRLFGSKLLTIETVVTNLRKVEVGIHSQRQWHRDFLTRI